MKNEIKLVLALAASTAAFHANAFDMNIASAVKSAYMADTGDAKRLAMLAGHPNGARSRDRRIERWRLISLKYRALNEAVDAAKPDLIQQRAIELQQVVHASKLFARCHSTMRGQAKHLAQGFDAAMTYVLTTDTGG